MENKINDALIDIILGEISNNEAHEIILNAHNEELSKFQKNRLDILNWAKSELKNETNEKLGKTMNPYRTEKIVFLRRVIKWIDNK